MSTWFRTYGFAEILDNLVIGAYPLDAGDVAMLQWTGVERVLNLVQDQEYRAGEREAVERAYQDVGVEEYRVDFIDFGHLPAESLEVTVQELLGWIDSGVRTYLHCRAGRQRSAAIAAGAVAIRQGLDIQEGLDFVQSRRPTADPLPHQREDLRRWWLQRSASMPSALRSPPAPPQAERP